MYKARYYKADGKKGKARDLPAALFDGVVNESVMHRVVQVYLANQRQGTAAAKTRSEVRGGSRKPWRQKGTGRARQGTIRAVQWEGGGVAFPPIPHSWRQRVPKKVKALARRSAYNARAEGDRVVLVDMPTMDAPKTKDLRVFLGGIDGAEGKKVLILTDGLNSTLHLSARNLKNVQVMPFGEESVYDVLWAHTVVIERGALDSVEADEAPAEEKPAAKKKAAPKKKAAAKKDAKAEEAPKAEAESAADEAPDAEAAADADTEAAAESDDEAEADEEKSDA